MHASIPKINNTFRTNTQPLPFTSLERNVYMPNCSEIKYRNNTCLLRGDMNWKMLAKHIKSKNKPQKIYCYACSDGSEAYSIALALINELGYEEAQKHFPIIAKDIDKAMIKRAQSGFISLGQIDNDRFSLLKNLKFEDYFKKTGVNDCTNSNTFYTVNKNLRKCVDFEVGNIISDSKNLEYNNSIIFFRNAMPYLSPTQQKILMKTFDKNFTQTTSFAIGSFDKNFIILEKDDRKAFDDLLSEGHLWEVKPMIYERHTLTDNVFNPINWGKIILNSSKNFAQECAEIFRPIIN